MKLLILSASTGGGHDMRANALKEWWSDRGGLAKVCHPLESSFIGYRFGCNLYNFIQKKFPLMHFPYFYFLEIAGMHRGAKRIIGAKYFLQDSKTFDPDIVVSMHSHLNHGFFDLLRKEISPSLPFVVYSGELADGLGFSRHWVNPNNNLFVGPTKECCLAAQKRGMPPGKCLVVGPLLRKSFYLKTSQSRSDLLGTYGLDGGKPTYLLSTGANGVNHHAEIINSFLNLGESCQIIALCGTNHDVYRNLSKNYNNCAGIKIIPLQTIQDKEMFQLLKSVDFVFARPGAGISTEALVTSCPIIFDTSGGVMPQETNNLNFWKKYSNLVAICPKPSLLPRKMKSLEKCPPLSIDVDKSPELFLSALEGLVRLK